VPDGIPITGVLGINRRRLGSGCIREGAAKCTYGTGAFMLLNTDASRARVVTGGDHGWPGVIGRWLHTYALEGSALSPVRVQWSRDGMKMIGDSARSKRSRLQYVNDGVVSCPRSQAWARPTGRKRDRMFTGLTRALLGRTWRGPCSRGSRSRTQRFSRPCKRTTANRSVRSTWTGAPQQRSAHAFQADVLG